MKKNLVIKLNMFCLLIILYLFIFRVYTIIATNNMEIPKSYIISSNKEEELKRYVYNNISNLEENITVESYPYVYTNNNQLIEKFNEYNKIEIENPILLGEKTYYINNYEDEDEYYYEGNMYNIGGVFTNTIIPMKYLSEENFLKQKNFIIHADEQTINDVSKELNALGYEVSFELNPDGGGTYLASGSYNIGVIPVLKGFVISNLSLILVLIISIYLSKPIIKNSEKKINNVLKLYGISKKKCYFIYFRKQLNITAVSFLLFLLVIFVLSYLDWHYIFLTQIIIKFIPLVLLLLLTMLHLFISPLIKVWTYVKEIK